MIQDHLGFIWIGTQNGLVRTTMTTFRYDPKNSNTLKGLEIRALYEDQNGDIWVGGESLCRFQKGLFRLNTQSGKLDYFRHDSRNTASIRCDLVAKVHVYRYGYPPRRA